MSDTTIQVALSVNVCKTINVAQCFLSDTKIDAAQCVDV